MRTSRAKRLVVAGILALAALTVYCGGQTEKTKTEIVHWFMAEHEENLFMEDLAVGFEQQNPGVGVRLEGIPRARLRTRLLSSFRAGSGPDTSVFCPEWTAEFVTVGALTELGTSVKRWKGRKDVPEAMFELFDDGMYCLPWQLSVPLLYSRMDRFRTGGEKPPEFQSGLIDIAEKFRKPSRNEYGLAFPGGVYGHEYWAALALSHMSKPSFYNETGDIDLLEPDVVKGNRFFLDLYHRQHVPPSALADGPDEVVDDFLSGRTVMMIHDMTASKPVVDRFGEDVTVSLIPMGPTGGRCVISDSYANVVCSTARSSKHSIRWISWLAEKDQIDVIVRAGISAAYLKSQQGTPEIEQNLFSKITVESMPFFIRLPRHVNTGRWVEDLFAPAVRQAVSGEIDNERMLEILQQPFE